MFPVPGHERDHLQHLGLFLRNATGAHIELLVFVQFPDRGAVRALHIICIDLQPWLCVDPGRVGKQDVVVLLERLGSLRLGRDHNLAEESALGLPGSQPVECLPERQSPVR